MLVDDFLGQSALRSPESLALVCDQRRLSYRELDEAANRLANGLQRLGIRRGDRVVLYLKNSVEAIVSIFGVLRAGAAFVPVGPTTKIDKLAYIVGHCEATALIVDQRTCQSLTDVLGRSPSVRAGIVVGQVESRPDLATGAAIVSFDEILKSSCVHAPAREQIDLDLAALIYTSGSTGQPKGVTLTHLNMVAAATSISSYLCNTSEDVILNVLPLSFDYGLYQVLLAFKAGARLVLEPSFVYPQAMLDLMVRERVTAFPIVPMVAVLLLKHDMSPLRQTLRYITNTGAVLPPAHIAALREQLPNTRIFSMYGLTECKRVAFLPPDEIEQRPTSVGKPMDNVEVFVADEEGNLHETGVGELVIRGSNVMQGYWRAPEETARVLKPGLLPGQTLLYSGDLFRIDEEGYMYFLARLDDMIKCRGQRVSPKEVENAIYELPSVTAVSVIGVPDEVWGQAVKAFVCIDGARSITEQEIVQHCVQRLEDFMVPRWVAIVDELPRTSTGKISRQHVKQLA